jgi:hypothetical protein
LLVVAVVGTGAGGGFRGGGGGAGGKIITTLYASDTTFNVDSAQVAQRALVVLLVALSHWFVQQAAAEVETTVKVLANQ